MFSANFNDLQLDAFDFPKTFASSPSSFRFANLSTRIIFSTYNYWKHLVNAMKPSFLGTFLEVFKVLSKNGILE
jgi:hypothetical protein